LAYHLASAHFIVESAANARGDIDGHDRTDPSVLPDRVERPWRHHYRTRLDSILSLSRGLLADHRALLGGRRADLGVFLGGLRAGLGADPFLQFQPWRLMRLLSPIPLSLTPPPVREAQALFAETLLPM
jgi:hypothetical protein